MAEFPLAGEDFVSGTRTTGTARALHVGCDSGFTLVTAGRGSGTEFKLTESPVYCNVKEAPRSVLHTRCYHLGDSVRQGI